MKRQSRKARACLPYWKNRAAVLIVEATATTRFGKDHGTQCFKCKDCGRTFTEYTGTWQQKLHNKGLVKAYMHLMSEQKSLDKY